MKLISIKWYYHLSENGSLIGLVMISDNHHPVGEWKIEVTPYSMHHTSSIPKKYMPPICSDIEVMREVEKIAKTYFSGYCRDESVHAWV